MFIFILICKIKIASTEWKIEILHRLYDNHIHISEFPL